MSISNSISIICLYSSKMNSIACVGWGLIISIPFRRNMDKWKHIAQCGEGQLERADILELDPTAECPWKLVKAEVAGPTTVCLTLEFLSQWSNMGPKNLHLWQVLGDTNVLVRGAHFESGWPAAQDGISGRTGKVTRIAALEKPLSWAAGNFPLLLKGWHVKMIQGLNQGHWMQHQPIGVDWDKHRLRVGENMRWGACGRTTSGNLGSAQAEEGKGFLSVQTGGSEAECSLRLCRLWVCTAVRCSPQSLPPLSPASSCTEGPGAEGPWCMVNAD